MSLLQNTAVEINIFHSGICDKPFSTLAALEADVMSHSVLENGSGTESKADVEMVASDVSNWDELRKDGENHVATKRLTRSGNSSFLPRSTSGKKRLHVH